MSILKNINLSISQCEMSDIIEESHRFVLHISLVHILTCIMDGKTEVFTARCGVDAFFKKDKNLPDSF